MALLGRAEAGPRTPGVGGATAWAGAAALLLVTFSGIGQTARAPEYQVKAVFLLNFAQFVAWPAAAFADSTDPLVIGILGNDPFNGFLDEAVRGEHVGGRPIVVQRHARVEQTENCDILFISQSETGRVGEILARLAHRPILTVADIEGFAERGGMIDFVTERGRIQLRINPAAAEAAHLTISSKLLRVAQLVALRER